MELFFMMEYESWLRMQEHFIQDDIFKYGSEKLEFGYLERKFCEMTNVCNNKG